VAVSSFYMWRSRIRCRDQQASNGSGSARFVELRAVREPSGVAPAGAPGPVRHDAPLELLLGADRRLLIHAGCDAKLLREVLAAFSPIGLPAVSPSNQPTVSLSNLPAVNPSNHLADREERSC
jgi:hypothetical protein